MSKPVILTGLRANNDLHIGNFFGALLPLIEMAKNHAEEYEVNLFVPDLHSFTTPIDHSQLQAQIMHNLKLFVAAGLPLDHPSIHIYRQSHVPAHSELTWILDCFTGFGEMSRMTQFKDKRDVFKVDAWSRAVDRGDHNELSDEEFNQTIIKDYQSRVSVGLFNYPVLMAADILLYGASYVPVGDDQTQHLEFARDIATRMNNQFGELFVVPKPVKEQHALFGKDQGLRIKDLIDPTKKMSKSDESGRGIIFLGDNPEEAARKIRSAATDSLNRLGEDVDPTSQPGVYNLQNILWLLRTYQGHTAPMGDHEGYGGLKAAVAEMTVSFLENFQAKFREVDEVALMTKLEADEQDMNDVANRTLYRVQQAVGLRPKD